MSTTPAFVKGIQTFVCDKHGEQQVYLFHEGQRLICAVCAQEESKERARLTGIEVCVKNIKIPFRYEVKTFENFQATTPPLRDALQNCRAYSDEWPENYAASRCLLLIGPPGVGKTHLACSVAHSVASQGYRARYATGGDYLREMRDTWHRNSNTNESAVLELYAAPSLLVLDDAGAGCGSDSEHRLWFDLIDKRYAAEVPTIVISNCDIPGLKLAIGDRAYDRLRENGGKLIVIKGESWRGRPVGETDAPFRTAPEPSSNAPAPSNHGYRPPMVSSLAESKVSGQEVTQ